LHRNYSFLFSTLSNGQEKKLIDASPDDDKVDELPDDPEEDDADTSDEVVAAPTNGATAPTTPAPTVTPEVVAHE
jgi:hypothetical protein